MEFHCMFLQTKNIIFFVKQPALKFDDRTFRAPCADPRQPIPNINFPVFLSQSLIKGYYLLGSRTSSTSRPVFFEREARTSKVLFLCFFANLSTPPLSFSPFLFLPLISSLPFFHFSCIARSLRLIHSASPSFVPSTCQEDSSFRDTVQHLHLFLSSLFPFPPVALFLSLYPPLSSTPTLLLFSYHAHYFSSSSFSLLVPPPSLSALGNPPRL